MAAVTKVKSKKERSPRDEQKANQKPQETDTNIEGDIEKGVQDDSSPARQIKVEEDEYSDVDAGEVIGIITLEDVMEELLQEEIVDEKDEFIDVANKVKVVAKAAQMNRGASMVRGINSFKNPQVGVSKQGNPMIDKSRQAENEDRQNRLAALGAQDDKNNLSEPLLDHQ